MPLSCDFTDDFISMLARADVGSLSLNGTTDMMYIKHNNQVSSSTLDIADINLVEPLGPFKAGVLKESDIKLLLAMYNKIYPSSLISHVGSLVQTCIRVKSLGVTFSVNSRADISSCICAKWCSSNSSFDVPLLDPTSELRPGIVKKFLIVNVKSQGSTRQHVVAKVKWLNPHPDRYFFGKPVEIWDLKGTQTDSAPSFLPIERIANRCVYTATTVQLSQTKEKVSVVIPLCTVVEI